jgi:hypothetical protein
MSIKYIFSINPGRSGSDYLTELLSKTVNAVSMHEGFPIMNGTAMQKFNEGDDSELRKLMPKKLEQIQRKSKNGRKIYCETNHSYIKGWGYLIPDEYIPQEEIGVIILQRNIDRTAYSLLRIHDVPCASEFSRTWYLMPGGCRNLSAPSENANPYELCKWYVEEIGLRAQEYKAQFPRITYVECDLEQLNNYDYVIQMFDIFGLKPLPQLKNVVGQPLNTRDKWPKLPLEEMLSLPKYPSADNLSPEKRDALVANMVTYLHEYKKEKMVSLVPDYAMGGTLAPAAGSIIACAERELEEAFKCSLMFGETEYILINEFIRSINPNDLWFIICDRSSPPGIYYKYNFNVLPDFRFVVGKMGLIRAIKCVWPIVAKARWKHDVTHRANDNQ